MTLVAQDNAVTLRWPQQPGVACYQVYGDGASGEGVDYDVPLNARPIVAWPDGEGFCGWGYGGWGYGPWGFGAGGPGWGLGGFGMGAWGLGAGVLAHTIRDLADGTYELAAVGYDAAGNAVTPATTTAEITLAGTPAPPTTLRPSSFETDQLTLTFILSPDDTG